MRLRHVLVAVLLAVAVLAQETWALAGTTGGLNGTVTDAKSGAPIANAKVTVSSPSETSSTKTDASGHFVFLSLAPDTYSVSAEKGDYQAVSQAGVTVFADSTQTVALQLVSIKTIITLTSKATSNLVKSGTTADVYSVNASTQDKISALGGGGSLNSAYAAVASVPGAFVPLNQTGYFQTVHIRGGDYDQVGYELDGVPVNRSFDNYPSGALSSLGMQELQVYTGAAPSNSEGQGLAGYINQVIKTGTYPGFGLADLGIGSPAFYHKAAVEVGGATPNRLFSYYIGIGGYDQDFRYVDQSNGSASGEYGFLAAPLAELAPSDVDVNGNCIGSALDNNYSYCYGNDGGVGPGGYALAPNVGVPALVNLHDRDVIANFHFALPHKYDSGRDDLQLLWDSGFIHNAFMFSTNDQGGANYLNAIGEGAPVYIDGYQYNGPTGVLLSSVPNASALVSNYYFPSQPAHSFFGQIPVDARDTINNNQEIVKLQYQKNFGTNAYLRVYGYSYYSDWLQNGPQSTYSNFVGPVSPDYELNSHTRGVSATFAKQLDSKNLLSLQASYTSASSIRDNNTQMLNSVSGTRARGVVLVNANDPLSGACYSPDGTTQVTCDPAKNQAGFIKWGDLQAGNIPDPATLAGNCGGTCGWLVDENSLYETYNTVKPKFTSYSLNDQFRPTDKLLLNLGARLDRYQFDGSSTNANDPARTFWFKSFNAEKCVQNSTGRLFDKTTDLGVSIGTSCSSINDPVLGSGFAAPNLVNESAQVLSYNEFQPRISGTYTFDPNNVLRVSFGKYAEPPNSAFEQYNSLQENLPNVLGAFVPFGFNTPGHEIRPAVSYNTDLSWEHQFKGTDISFKISPFLRKTKDQIQQFFLDQKSSFVSGLNVGRQTSEGVEFQVNKGDFNRNGLAGLLSFTYTHSFIDYDTLANGNTVVAGINNDIDAFNKLTKGGGGAPCYVGGTPTSNCAQAGAFANPYYNTPLQGHVPANGLPTYDLLPGPVGASADAFGAPYFATLVLNYKHDKWAITPSLQVQAGARYGSPESNLGVDPATCSALAGSDSALDPRYVNSGWGGIAGVPGYDATTCGSVIPIPNVLSKHFDAMGEYVQPTQLVANLQLSYEASPKVTLVATFANLVNTCFGGSKEPWTSGNHNFCSYGLVYGGLLPPVGNVYNPGSFVQPSLAYPYQAALGAVNVDGNSTKTPFNFYIDARIKL
jgi:hypothetical protein